jgi:Fur family ferric uptake transcriptional regulator
MRGMLEKLCSDRGLKLTGQRRVVADVITDAKDHPDAEEVYQRAVKIDSNIGRATVYRTLRLFQEMGVIAKHDFGDGRARYETSSEDHHDHLIDMTTGKVIEFQNTTIEALQEKIAAELGYELVGHRLELFGVPLPGKTSK